MAYNKINNTNKEKEVNYLAKDFNSFKNRLTEFAQSYFPNNFNDFSEGNPGMMFLEMAAYVGDVLSFYTDTQIQETFLNLAQEKSNIYNIAHVLGYKPKLSSAATTNLDITQLVPSDPDNDYEPDFDYTLDILQNSSFSTLEGEYFYIIDDVRFGFSSSFNPTDISIYQYDSSNNPEYYLLKKSVKAVSGVSKTQTFVIGAPEKFTTLELQDSNILSIESISDSDGNIWTEVPYLAQDTIFEEVANNAANDPSLHQYNHQTPYLLKLKKVTKRFTTKATNERTLEINFGAGISDKSDEQIIPNPDNIGLGIKDGRNALDKAYDPSNFLYTKTYGEAPSNTTLTVTYKVGGGLKSNVGSNTITSVGTLLVNPKSNVNQGLLSFSKQSVTSTNPEAAKGGGDGETIEDIRLNTMAGHAAQKRTVTKNDYIIRTLSMPPHLGRIAKAYIMQDDQTSPLTNEPNRIPNPLALNLYTLGYNSSKHLTTLNTATKTNLSTYLEQFRMLTDAVNIKDAFIINFQVDFEITVYKTYNNEMILLQCISELKNYFNIDKWQLNQPIILSEIRNLIGGVGGVQTVESLVLKNISGEELGYSQYRYGFEDATRNDVIYPSMDTSIFELKYPNKDIKGRVTIY